MDTRRYEPALVTSLGQGFRRPHEQHTKKGNHDGEA